MKKQVEKDHYTFGGYINKPRWSSMWHQLDEVLALEPETVLEIGPGPGVFKAVAKLFGPCVETLDLDPELKPDHVAPADEMPFKDCSYDVVCAFQMLEHVPYEKSLSIFAEMARVARKGLVISLPDAETRWPIGLYIPRVGLKWCAIPKPRLRRPAHLFNGEHYWELNKSGYRIDKVKADLLAVGNVKLIKNFRVHDNQYHHFFSFRK